MKTLHDLVASDIPSNPPEGFVRVEIDGGFHHMFGPIWLKTDRATFATLAFRVSPRHLNLMETCHGGILASFADMQAFSARQFTPLPAGRSPTISLSVDYLSPAQLGDWVEGDVEVLQATSRTLFTSMIGRVGSRSVFRSSGIFRLRKGTEHETP